MNKKFTFFLEDIYIALNSISGLYSEDEIYRQETSILIGITGILAGSANAIFFALYVFWDLSLFWILFNLILTSSFYLILFKIKKLKIEDDIKIHIASAMVFVEYLFIFFMLYKYITIVYWFTFLLILIPATLLSNNITFKYILVLMLFTIFLAHTLYRDITLSLDFGYMFATVSIFLFVIFMLYIMKKAFSGIIKGKLDHIRTIEKQREKILLNENKLKDKNEELKKVAFYDELTNLPNRRNVFDTIKFNIKEKTPFVLVNINIDKFKDINDSLGHAVGDKILIALSEVLIKKIEERYYLSRASGDHFVILIDDKMTKDEVLEYVSYLSERDDLKFKVGNYNLSITCSSGIVKYPEDGDNITDLLVAMDSALSYAKSLGKDNISFYDVSMKEDIISRINMESKLSSALGNDEFFLVYQPIVDCRSEKVVSAECLLRWESPELGSVGPAKFIPSTERLGIINDLGYMIMEKAIYMMKRVKENLDIDIKFSINVSVIQLKKSGFVDDMLDMVNSAGIDPKNIIFELTESVFLEDEDFMNNAIKTMRKRGFKIAIDDFGTGYSSFNYLTRLPVDIIKIDKSFIDLIGDLNENEIVVTGLISIAHILGMQVTAEGVEENLQLNFLRESKVDFIQGYYFSKPLKEDEFIDFVKNKLEE